MSYTPFKMKNMEYWKAKNGLSGVSPNKDNGQEGNIEEPSGEQEETGGKNRFAKTANILGEMAIGGLNEVYGGKQSETQTDIRKRRNQILSKDPGEDVKESLTGQDIGGKSYTVQSGDSLSKIAKANNTTVEELMKKNPQITDKNVIISGQKIKF